MKVIDAHYKILRVPQYADMISACAGATRTCYKSISKGVQHDVQLLEKCIRVGHESVLEHHSISVLFVCDRGISHEIVRHRLASFSQESTRYCNYSKDRFGNELTFIRPYIWARGTALYEIWLSNMQRLEAEYLRMLRLDVSPQWARSILPNSLKTEIVVTANIREWRHILALRTAPPAHPQIKELMIPLLYDLKQLCSVFFQDIQIKENEYGKENEENQTA
jgi:thymidylate synthase (FAD)